MDLFKIESQEVNFLASESHDGPFGAGDRVALEWPFGLGARGPYLAPGSNDCPSG